MIFPGFLDGPIRANRFAADLRRFARIARTLWKQGFFCESIRAHHPDSRCEWLGHLSLGFVSSKRHRLLCQVDQPGVLGATKPSPEQKVHVYMSGQVWPRQGTEICNFGAPSPLEALHWIFCFFSSIYVQFSKTSPLKSGESSEYKIASNPVTSVAVMVFSALNVPFSYPMSIGCTTNKGSCKRTVLWRKRFLEGFLEGALQGFQ